MVVVINGEKIPLDSSYLKNNKIGFGSEGGVYKFGDYALKLYYDNPRKIYLIPIQLIIYQLLKLIEFYSP